MNNLTDIRHIPDTQSERDERHLAIQRVGVKDVRWPLVLSVAGQAQHVTAQWDLDVALPADKKGTHMSRFVAWLDQHSAPMDAATLRQQLAAMLALLGAEDGRIEARFDFFLRKRAPVSGVQNLLDYRAHNQRSLVTIRVELLQAVEWQTLVRFAEESASSEIWALLKRPDEKWVTERAYENPKFVEDLVRDVALRLDADARIGGYSVDVENFESIHNHSAFARIERGSGV